MPIKLEKELYRSVKKAHPNYSEARIKEEVFKILNKKGLLHRKKKARPWSSQAKIRKKK